MDPEQRDMEERSGLSADAVPPQPGGDGLLGPAPKAESEGEGTRPSRKSIVREYAEAIILAMVLAFAIRVFVVQAFKIPSGSMEDTLLIGDHILVTKLAYGLQWPADCHMRMNFPPVTCYTSEPLIDFGDPDRGDVIVFRFPEDENKDFIKRVIGLPGETIELRDKVVYIDGEPLDDGAYAQRKDFAVHDGSIQPRDNYGPVVVPQDSYFVMGDNRDHSLDSRFWGFVTRKKIKGRAFLIYWSWTSGGGWLEWVRWDRLGKSIE